jgi:hypothetical protein
MSEADTWFAEMMQSEDGSFHVSVPPCGQNKNRQFTLINIFILMYAINILIKSIKYSSISF